MFDGGDGGLVDGGGQAGGFLTDLSKAFDCIDHELLIAKLYVYGFDKNSLYFIKSYLKRRKQRTKLNSSYSTFAEILLRQGSILGPLLFNIYICDLFFENSYITLIHYIIIADDSTPYACSSDLDSVIFKLQKNIEIIFGWFHNNNLISNAKKCHLIVSFKENLDIQVSSCFIRNEDNVKLLGMHINNNLNYDYHVNQLRKKTSKKLHALARNATYMVIKKRRMLMKAFVSSQFSYCPQIWMFDSRKMRQRINSIHKRALKLVYQDSHDLTFQELLVKGKSVSVHQKNLQLLATEIFKSKTGVLPELMNAILHFVERPYNLRNDYALVRKRDHTVYHGSQSHSSLAPKLRVLLPNSIKNSAFLKEFKTKINTWAADRCPCRICKNCVWRVGFI